MEQDEIALQSNKLQQKPHDEKKWKEQLEAIACNEK